MSRVALVGGASETRWMLEKSRADEFWTVNWSYNYDWIKRIDRLFEVHPAWLYASVDKPEWKKPRDHWDWLTKHVGYPVYMQRKLPSVPESIEYPLEEVISSIFGDRLLTLTKDGEYIPGDIFGSSMDYMMGLALLEGFDEIEVIGIEMGSNTEYRYQRESFAVWTGIAIGRGVRVIRGQGSSLFRIKRYGYEGGQMIFRQDLERLYEKRSEEYMVALARVQHFEGRLAEVLEDTQELPQEMADEYRDLRDDLTIKLGWKQSLEYLIKSVDLQEVEDKIENPLVAV